MRDFGALVALLSTRAQRNVWGRQFPRITRLATGVHLSISLATNAVNSSEVMTRVSTASRSRRLRTSGSCNIFATAALSRYVISFGKPAGPDSANHVTAVRSS